MVWRRDVFVKGKKENRKQDLHAINLFIADICVIVSIFMLHRMLLIIRSKYLPSFIFFSFYSEARLDEGGDYACFMAPKCSPVAFYEPLKPSLLNLFK